MQDNGVVKYKTLYEAGFIIFGSSKDFEVQASQRKNLVLLQNLLYIRLFLNLITVFIFILEDPRYRIFHKQKVKGSISRHGTEKCFDDFDLLS